MKTVQVLGRGAWGSALGHLLESNGHRALLCDSRSEPGWEPEVEAVVLAVPSRYLASGLGRWPAPPPGTLVVSGVKGIEPKQFRRPSEMVRDAWGDASFSVLSGPSFAEEVKAQAPTAVVVASEDEAAARRVQELFHRPEFRVYTTLDVTGVELGGSLKNVFAIAAGIGVGLGYGHNTMAALLARALAEMSRVGVAMGGKLETFMGLSGVGDLVLTCYGALSRNRRFGEGLGQGMSAEAAAARLGGVAEGTTTVLALHELTRARGLDAPLVNEVYEVIEHGKSPERAVQDLLLRSPKPE